MDILDDPQNQASASQWKLVCPADEREWNVSLEAPPPNMLDSLQLELKALLFTDE